MNARTSTDDVTGKSGDPLGRARRVLRHLHLWVAFILCLPLIVLGLTGSILVFSPEIGELLNPPPNLRVETGNPHSVAEVIAVVQAKVGDGYTPFLYQPPGTPGQPAIVRLAPLSEAAPRKPVIEARVDPVSLRFVVNRYTPLPGIIGKLVELHGNLLMGRVGRDCVGWLGVAMLALGVSGLILWWPRRSRWRAALLIKRGARGLRLHRDIHGAVGIWTLAVSMAVIISGVYLVFPQTVGSIVRTLLPSHEDSGPVPIVRTENTKRIDADRAIAVALAGSLGAQLRSIWLPLQPSQPYRVSMAHPGDSRGAPDMVAQINPWSGELMQLTDPARFAPAQTVLAWQQMIHFGHGLGWVWRIFVCLSGLLPAIFAYTGIAMWLIKRSTRRRAVRIR